MSLVVGLTTAVLYFHWLNFTGLILYKALINKREDWCNHQEMIEKNKNKLRMPNKRSEDTRVKIEGAVSP